MYRPDDLLIDGSKPDNPSADQHRAGSAPDHETGPIFELKPRPRGPSILKRTLAVLSLERGTLGAIASDRDATRQAFAVFVIASSLVGGRPDSPWVLLNWTVALVPVTIQIVLFRLAARVLATEVPPFQHWFRAMLFATAPWVLLGAVPVVGTTMGTLYVWVVQVVAIRELCRISTGRAFMTWLTAMLAIAAVAALAVTLILFRVIDLGDLRVLLGL